MEQIKLYSVYTERHTDDDRSFYLQGTFTTIEEAQKCLQGEDETTLNYYKGEYGNDGYTRRPISDRFVEYFVEWDFDETNIFIVEHELGKAEEIML